MDLLPSFGKSTYPTIIIRSLDTRKTTIYNAWKATMSTKTLPQIECVQSFFDGESQQPPRPPPTSHVANLTLDDGICTDDDTGNVTHLTNQQTNIENLLDALKRISGYESFKPEQYEAIQAILQCQDVFVQMPTGAGKSLIFQIIASVSSGLVVCVSPLISLIKDQTQACNEKNIGACFLYGTMDSSQKESIYYSLRQPVCPFKIPYVTPEFITQDNTLLNILNSLYSKEKLRMFAIDEAHCVSQWGHDFRSAYLNLDVLRKNFKNVPILLLTASATKQTRDDCMSVLGLNNPKIILSTVCRPNLVYEVHQKSSKSVEHIASIVKPLGCSLVFCSTIRECEDICPKLEGRGVKCKMYHGQLEDNLRSQRQEMWSNGSLQCLVCTSSFGLGVNKPNVKAVIHYSLPGTLEAYVQEAGRGGRDGSLARCILYFTLQNQIFHLKNIFSTRKTDSKVADKKLSSFLQMLYWCFQNVECRKVLIMKHFGEPTPSNCGTCDICRSTETVTECDITEISKKAILCIQRVASTPDKKNFTLNYISKILTGKKVKHDHDKYPEYRCITDSTEFGEYLLRLLVCKEVLVEQPPPEAARNQNTVYLTVGAKYLQVLSGQLAIKCIIKSKNC